MQLQVSPIKLIVPLFICLILYSSAIQSQSNENIEEDDNFYNKLLKDLTALEEQSTYPSSSPLTIEKSAEIATAFTVEILTQRILTQVFGKENPTPPPKTAQCRAKIVFHLSKYIDAIAAENPLPYSDTKYKYDCPLPHLDADHLPEGTTMTSLMQTTYQPPKNESEYIDREEDLILLYGILMHESSHSTIRLIETLSSGGMSHNKNTIFVVHVDGKEKSDDAYHELVEYSLQVGNENVHIVPNEYRVRVNWGGFSMVNATMQILQYSFGNLSSSSSILRSKIPNEPFKFHKFINLSGSTYPIKSNTKIRQTISSYPLDANLMYIAMKPLKSPPPLWQYFVECDDALHRIYNLHQLNPKDNNVSQYMGSQWFIISYEFAKYLADMEDGSFVKEYSDYAEHFIIADEGFFTTILRNTRFCVKHHNQNFVHLHFDRWESDIRGIDRDQRKCLMKNQDHCGRSPTTLTKDYMYALEMTHDLFARKFDEDNEVKDILDKLREKEEEELRAIAEGGIIDNSIAANTTFEGHGVLLVAKDTISDHSPLCLSLGKKGNYVRLIPCFWEAVLGTLAPDWATGAVIEEEVQHNSRWQLGPCSNSGNLFRDPSTAEMNMTRGEYSPEGPHCMIKQLGGIRNGRCIDIMGERVEPGGIIQMYPCQTKFHNLFSFGDDIIAPKGSIFATVPNHIVKALKYKGKEQYPYLCLGAMGRSKIEYTPWEEDKNKERYNTVDFVPEKAKKAHMEGRKPSLRLWKDKQLVTIPCNDEDAVVTFVVVPFIVEDDDVPDADIDGTDVDEIKTFTDGEL